jgi:hypothetical protein
MAVLRYKDENGVYQDLVGINVQNEVVQTTGTSTTAVMSQNAVTNTLSGKADKTATVSSVTYDSSANMLKQTINGVTTDITPIVQSGFVPQFNGITGIMELNPVGGATIAPNATTGIIEMTF